jgi:hypothetical protein
MTARKFNLEKFREDWQRQLVADRTIPLTALKVAVAICWHMNRKKGGWAWPGISKLDKLTGLHRTTVMRAIKWLEDNCYLRVMRGYAGNQRSVNRYLPLLRSSAKAPATKEPTREQTVAESDYPSRSMERPKPPREPLTLNTPYLAATSVAAPQSSENERLAEEGDLASTSEPSLAAQCYASARQNPHRRPGDAALVTLRLRTIPAEDLLQAIKQAAETGYPLREVLFG